MGLKLDRRHSPRNTIPTHERSFFTSLTNERLAMGFHSKNQRDCSDLDQRLFLAANFHFLQFTLGQPIRQIDFSDCLNPFGE